jgi:CspA family cold shock protein
MYLTHKVEHKGDKLRVTVEIPLADVIAHQCEASERMDDPLYRHVMSYLLQRIPDDIWEVAGILHEEGEVGHVKWFDDRRGFGFIRTYDRQDIFVHHSQLAGEGYRTVEQGQRVRFKRRFVRREGAEVLEAIDVEPVTE